MRVVVVWSNVSLFVSVRVVCASIVADRTGELVGVPEPRQGLHGSARPWITDVDVVFFIHVW